MPQDYLLDKAITECIVLTIKQITVSTDTSETHFPKAYSIHVQRYDKRDKTRLEKRVKCLP